MNAYLNKLKIGSSKNLIKYFLVALGVLILAIFVYEHWFNLPPNRYTYKGLESYTLHSGTKGTDLTFQKPVEQRATSSTNQVFLTHTLVTDSLASYMSAAIIPLATPYIPTQLASLSKTISNPSDKYYGQEVAPIKKFIQARLFSDTTLNMANAKSFTGSYIKKNAWQFDYTANSLKHTANKNIKGTAILAITDKGYYYFMIYTPDTNWKHNLKIWNQVLSSLKPS